MRKNKSGFTLVELIGVITILAIVMGLAVVSYINIKKSIKESYYKGLEETLLMSGSDYFSYAENKYPVNKGDFNRVFLEDLINDKYIESNSFVDQDGNSCDLGASYVIAYRNMQNSIDYTVCLVCGDYKSDGCNQEIDSFINLNITIGDKNGNDTGKQYIDGTYTNGSLILHFNTSVNVTNVYLNDQSGSPIASCEVNADTRRCSIVVNTTGNYKAHGYEESTGKSTNEENVKILLDNQEPTFEVFDGDNSLSNNGTFEIELEENDIDVSLQIKNIHDSLSGIKRISYSFESDGENHEIIPKSQTEFTIEKKLTPGIYNLIVEVTDNASNSNTFRYTYSIKGYIAKPLDQCNELTYNGNDQTLAKPYAGVTYENNTGKNKGTYTVITKLNTNYYWTDGTRDDYEFNCIIEPKNASSLDIGLEQDIYTYDGGEKRPNAIIYDGEMRLENGVDYTLSYQNNINVNSSTEKPTVIVNYKGNYYGTSSVEFNITHANPNVTLSNENGFVEIGSSIDFTVSSNIDGYYNISVSPNNIVNMSSITESLISANSVQTINLDAVNVGTATVTIVFTPNSSNYNVITKTYNVVVYYEASTGSCIDDIVYDENSHTLASGGVGVSYLDNEGINAITYRVTVKTDENYLFSDGTSTKTLDCSIAKATPELMINGTPEAVSTIRDVEVSISPSTKANLSIESSDKNILSIYDIDEEIEIDGGVNKKEYSNISKNVEKSVILSANSSGTVTLTLSLIPVDSVNYNAVTKTFNLDTVSKYCADFYTNGAAGIGSSSLLSTSVCCVISGESEEESCTITLPNIIPKPNFEVIGWNNAYDEEVLDTPIKLREKTDSVLTTYELHGNDTEFYAVTKQSDASRTSYQVTFDINNADAYIYNDVNYTETNTFTCTADYVYNGGEFLNNCLITLPQIIKNDSVAPGWDLDPTFTAYPRYNQSELVNITNDTTLYAITTEDVKTITLTIDPNGGSTTIEPIVKMVSDQSEGAWFTIPAYDNANLCRNKENAYHGYKYAGLTTDSNSKVKSVCQGERIYLSEDTTLYPIWDDVYSTSRNKISSNITIRSSANSNGTYVGSISSGSTFYITGPCTSCFHNADGEDRIWCPVLFGSTQGFATAGKNCDYANFNAPSTASVYANSCDYTDYSCSTGQSTDFTITPDEVILNIAENITTKQLQINTTCGQVVSVDNSNPSLISATKDGLIEAIPGIVGYKEPSQRATLTYNTEGNCTAQVIVIVKNIETSPPTVDITIAGISEDVGYRVGAEVTATCNSPSGISNFTLTGGTEATIEETETNRQVMKTILDTDGGNIRVTATCTADNGLTRTVTRNYRIYVYSQHNSCDCQRYSSCQTPACGTETRTTYGAWTSYNTSTCKTSSSTLQCQAGTVYNKGKSTEYCITMCRTVKRTTTVRTCRTEACGCEVRKSCWHV